MDINPDTNIIWEYGFIHINSTILFTWITIFILVMGSWLVTRKLSYSGKMTRWQNLLEVLVEGMKKQIKDISRQEPGKYLDFVGTLFIFILVPNILSVIPGFDPPTRSLSTTSALAACVFVGVPLYGISQMGFKAYIKQYIKPSVLMLPFNIISEISRTIALAIRLYGNIMSATIIAGIILGIAPLVFPLILQAFGLLTGVIQAYIFAVLAMVYIASNIKVREKMIEKKGDK
jgi:F-type H+-transporting ATPase subunit a